MKKHYSAPECLAILICDEDILTTSPTSLSNGEGDLDNGGESAVIAL